LVTKVRTGIGVPTPTPCPEKRRSSDVAKRRASSAATVVKAMSLKVVNAWGETPDELRSASCPKRRRSRVANPTPFEAAIAGFAHEPSVERKTTSFGDGTTRFFPEGRPSRSPRPDGDVAKTPGERCG